MATKIAAGLERAFAARGFAEPSVEDLRDAAGVSLRTLYKYAPSRDIMVRLALEHRHQRYLIHVFDDPHSSDRQGLDQTLGQTLDQTLDRIADWMRTQASHGCLFHAAVAAAPNDPHLRALLERHKAQVSRMAVSMAQTKVCDIDVMVIIEGLTQAWPLAGEAALDSARRLVRLAENDAF